MAFISPHDEICTFVHSLLIMLIVFPKIFCAFFSEAYMYYNYIFSTKHVNFNTHSNWMPPLVNDLIDLLCLTRLSAMFQPYHGDQF